MAESPSLPFVAAEADGELITLIGRIAVRWANLDWALIVLLGRFIGDIEKADTIYYSLNNFSAKIDIISNLVREFVPDEAARQATLKVLSDVHDLSQDRNDLIHSPIVVHGRRPGKLSQYKRRPKRRNPTSHPPIDKKAMERHSDRIQELFDLVMGAGLADYKIRLGVKLLP